MDSMKEARYVCEEARLLSPKWGSVKVKMVQRWQMFQER
jgi:hypothetical protein